MNLSLLSTMYHNNTKTFILSGVPGCGKTTVANHLHAVYGLTIANLGSLMFEGLARQLKITHRDQIRVLPPQIMDQASNLAIKNFLQKKTQSHKILVTHFFPQRSGHIYFPQNYSKLGKNFFEGIVMLIATPNEIYKRHQRDMSRNRAPVNIRIIAKEQRHYLLVALITAWNLGIPCWVVENPDNKIDQTTRIISRLLTKKDL